MADGKTQQAIDKWNAKKSNAILKGDDKFVKKNIDYFSNEEIARLKTRVEAKTSINDLEQSARKITEEKLRSWSNMINSVSNAAKNGIDIYNSVAKISNSLFGKKMSLIKDAEEKKEGITEIERTFNSAGDKTTEVTKSVKDGVNIKETRTFVKSKNDDSDKGEKSSNNDKTPPKSPPPAPTSGGSAKTETAKSEPKVERVSGEVVGNGRSNAERKSSATDAEYRYTTGTSLVPSYWGGNPSGNSSKSSSSSSSTGGFKGFKNNMSPNASKAVKDVDDYTDELFKILNGKGYI